MAEITFKCPECGKQITFVPAYAGKTMPCPQCGDAVEVPDPEKEAERRRRGKLFWAIQVILLISICWGLTLYLGPPTIRRDVRETEASLREGFRTIRVSIRSPLPFVISFRIKAGDSKSQYQIDSTIIKYYLWFFRFRRMIPFKDYRRAPFFLKWVWLYD